MTEASNDRQNPDPPETPEADDRFANRTVEDSIRAILGSKEVTISISTEHETKEEGSAKDFWDKLSSVSTFFSSVIIAVVALIVTTWLDASNNARREAFETAERERQAILERQQQKTHELDVMAKYLPYLSHEDEVVRFNAVQSIRILASTEIATLVAKIDPSPGKTAALVAAASETTDTEERARIIETLGTIVSGRPAFIVKQHNPIGTAGSEWERTIESQLSVITSACRSTGRIEIEGHPSCEWVGTGWVASDTSIVIPRYVLETFAIRNEEQGWVFLQRTDSEERLTVSIDFGEELDGESRSYRLGSIKHVEERNDNVEHPLAVLEVIDLDTDEHPPLRFLDGPRHLDPGAEVFVVGYPAMDARKPPEVVRSVFGDVFDVKRVMPGRIMRSQSDDPDDLVSHDCSTLGGTGGAPLIDFYTGEVVGIHVGSRYLERGMAVATWRLNEILQANK